MQVQLTEKGLIAFSVIVSCTTLLIIGRDTVVSYVLFAVVAGYFGIEIIPPRIKRANKRR